MYAALLSIKELSWYALGLTIQYIPFKEHIYMKILQSYDISKLNPL